MFTGFIGGTAAENSLLYAAAMQAQLPAYAQDAPLMKHPSKQPLVYHQPSNHTPCQACTTHCHVELPILRLDGSAVLSA